jgi:hypothetical protein
MLDTFHPKIRFIKNRVCCGVWPAVPIVKMIGTWIWATPAQGKVILKFDASGPSRHASLIQNGKTLDRCPVPPDRRAAGDPKEVWGA